MRHARQLIEAWRIEYNTERLHSPLDYLTRGQFAQNRVLTMDSIRASGKN
ncbi:integrase core domain-containing protein [Chitiniphilus shinanonensis]